MVDRIVAGIEELLQRMCAEYLEMPGLSLTRRQAQRLLGLDEQTCVRLLDALLETRFLRQRPDGTYVRVSEGSTARPRFQMLKAGSAPTAARANERRR
jgi:DNA-binding IclR family transcriptional regulator